MRRFLAVVVTLAALALILISVRVSGQVRNENKEFELAKIQRNLSKELGERQCGPYFVVLDFGQPNKELYVAFYYNQGDRIRNDATPKARTAVEIDDKRTNPLVRFTTNKEGQEIVLFVLSAKDYKATEGCLPAPTPQK